MEAMPTAANASLISMRSSSATSRPALPRAFLIAFDGWKCRPLSGPATVPNAPTSARTVAPSSSAFLRLVTIRAAAPSEICDEEPAVIVPSAPKAAGSFARRLRGRVGADALVGLEEIVSLRDLTSTGTISSRRTPSLAALAARCCERAANSSWSSRLMPSFELWRSVDSPIDRPSNASVRPSSAIESSISTAPYL